MLLLSTTIVGHARTTDSALAMVQLLFDHLGGIGDIARTAVRCYHHCAGAWAKTCIQKQGLSDTCGHLFNHCSHFERAIDHSQPTVLSAVIFICGMGVFGLVYTDSLIVLRGESYAKRFDRLHL